MMQKIFEIVPCLNEETVLSQWFKPLKLAATAGNSLWEVQRMQAPRFLMGAVVGQYANIND